MSVVWDAIDPKRRFMRRFGVLIFVALLAGCASSPQLPRSEVGESVTPLPLGDESRIGLALGGGAARGFAHVGVIQVLEEAGIRPQFVVGTSAGSLVAALYASGMHAAELKKTAISMQEAAITDWLLPIFNRGALKGDALAQYVNQQVQNRSIENMSLPLGIVATDLRTGEAVVFRRGNTGTAVRASSAVPGVFLPVKIGDREYVDGGLVAPVPVQQARQMGANFVIAVDISSDPQSGETGDVFKILLQTFTIMGRSINALALRQADLVVRPSLKDVGSADFASRERSIEQGRQAMLAALPLLRQKLAELKR
ncbi:MAG: family protein RssA [Pseudomonadota bacterium]|jgi:NTE family protein